MKTTNSPFLSIFSQIKDPRVENDNKKHLLIDIITIAVCAVICWRYGKRRPFIAAKSFCRKAVKPASMQ